MALKIKIALIVVTAILVLSLAANGNLYFLYQERDRLAQNSELQEQVYSDLQVQVADLQSQITDLQIQVTNLTAKANSLQTENAQLLSQKAELQSKLENITNAFADFPLDKPRLITRLGASNVIESAHGNNPRLFVEGDVFNTGGVTARDAKLHVTLFIEERVVADVSLPLGDIESFGGAHVSRDIGYSSPRLLTNWTIIPECSS